MHYLKPSLFVYLFYCFQLQADIFYVPRDICTLCTDQSCAKSINQFGCIAGKCFENDVIYDYIWLPETGMRVITTDAIVKAYPRINNYGQVAGVLSETHSCCGFFTRKSKVKQLYFYDPIFGLQILGFPQGCKWDEGKMSVVDINDKGQILIANHSDMHKAKKFAIWDKNGFSLLLTADSIPVALNNFSEIFTYYEDFCLCDCLSEYHLKVSNLDTQHAYFLAQDKMYVGLGMNDKAQVIAKDKNGRKGFFGSLETGMVDLGNFIPTAINNHGEMVGKLVEKDGYMHFDYLRMKNGALINLSEVILNNNSYIKGFEGILNAWSINDNAQIVVSAKIDGREHVLLLEPLEIRDQQCHVGH